MENDFPHEQLEIMVVDGGSTDGTIDVINSYIDRYSFIRLIHNEKRLKPIALNIGIKASSGDVIMRIDAHAIYDNDYISKLVDGLYTESVDNVGGVRDTFVPSDGSPMEIALSEAISHPLVVGNAYYRTGVLTGKKLVDTVFCGCYRRDVFEKIGLFNEKLIRTQDRELNTRLIKSGGKIMLFPDVHCTYYPRTRLPEYLVWNWKGAEWLGYAKLFTEYGLLSFRNFIPSMFALYVVAIVLFGLYCLMSDDFYGLFLVFLIPLFLYSILLFRAGTGLSIRYKKPGLFFIFPMVTFLTHVSYGFALLWGRFRAVIAG